MYSTAKFALFLTLCVLVQSDEFAPDGAIKAATKVVLNCMGMDETMTCFKLKTVKLMDALIKTKNDVPISDIVTLARVENDQENQISSNEAETVLSEEELDASLPRQYDEKNSRLDQLLWQKLQTLLETRTINLHSPVEGRGKDKGYKGKGAMIMMMGGMMMKMMMMGSSLLSLKAIMIAKAALILAGIVALKKLGGGGDSHPQVVLAPHGTGGGHSSAGSIPSYYSHEPPPEAQEMAYGSQQPTQGYYRRQQ